MITSPGRLLLDAQLPPEFRDYGTLDKKAITKLFDKIAKTKSSSEYARITENAARLGNRIAYEYGGLTSVHLSDLVIPPEFRAYREQIKKDLRKIEQDPTLNKKEKRQKILDYTHKATETLDKEIVEYLAEKDNAFGVMVKHGIRGNPTQLRQMVFGDLITVDSKMRAIPHPTLTSYAEGVSPLDYWNASHGGRYGYVQIQMATPKAGYLSRRARQIAHRIVVTSEDCGDPQPLMVDADDTNNIGSVLARDVKGKDGRTYKKDTIITEDILDDLDGDIPVRSAETCKAPEGICAKCAGVHESGSLPEIGDVVGLNDINSFMIDATQAAISCLHPGTPVRMADWSIKPISKVKVGDKVLGVDLNGKYSPTTVTRVYNHGLMPMNLYVYRQGNKTSRVYSLVSTSEHKALQTTIKSNCKGGSLNHMPQVLPVGTRARRISMLPVDGPVKTLEGKEVPEALFLGLMVGDGCYTEGGGPTPHFSCADPELIADTQSYMEALGMRFSFHKGSECYWAVVNVAEVNIPGEVRPLNPAKQLLVQHNMWGKYAHDKEFPTGYKDWSSASIAAFISGLIITDGSIHQTKGGAYRVSFGSTSLKLLRQLVDMLNRHCGAARPRIRRVTKNRKHAQYYVSWAHAQDLLKILSFVQLYGIKEKRRLAALYTVSKLCEKDKPATRRREAKRISCRELGYYTAYDIEVDHPDHLFLLSNGLVVSNSKHVGGEEKSAKRIKKGFEAIEQFLDMPENFVGGAVMTETDGKVGNLRPAPQGGQYLAVGDNEYWIPPDAELKVKPGDIVEAGDALTSGMLDISKVVEFKGLGEARKEFVNGFRDVLRDNKLDTQRRSLESVARGYLNKVRITDPDGLFGRIAGDYADYDDIAAHWEPRENSRKSSVDSATGYLDAPALHYTIGTRVTPKVREFLRKNGVKDVTVNPEPPPFEPVMVRARGWVNTDKDFLTALSGENLMKTFIDRASRGANTYKNSTSYFPQLAFESFAGDRVDI